MPTVEEKQALAMQPDWPIEVAAEYFDVSPTAIRRLMGGPASAKLDRFELEKKLTREEVIGLEWLALEFGVPRDALERAMRTPPVAGLAPFQLDEYKSDDRYLIPRRIAEAWVKTVLPKHKVWSSLDGRARDLASVLGSSVRECAVSKRFQESPGVVATCRCIVTWDDVSRAHQEYVDNRKNLSLEPDHVGWHAIFDKKIPLTALWRVDTTNMETYLEQRGVKWAA